MTQFLQKLQYAMRHIHHWTLTEKIPLPPKLGCLKREIRGYRCQCGAIFKVNDDGRGQRPKRTKGGGE